jgi:hypothetical protein
MWIERIMLDLSGDGFSPNAFLKSLTVPIIPFGQNESADPNSKDPSGSYGFGSLSIVAPQHYGVQHFGHVEYEAWYINFLNDHRDLIRQQGVSSIELFIEFFHDDGQLNTEVLSRDAMKIIAEFNIALPLSYYRVRREALIEMLSETDLSPEQIAAYVAQHPIGT